MDEKLLAGTLQEVGRLSSSRVLTTTAVDFSQPDIRVRDIFDPAKTGHTTGRVVRHAARDYAFIRLRNGEIAQIPCEHLEVSPEKETREDAIRRFQFSGPEALQRAIITEKVRGQLTDVFYSMGSGHADFYPHQFKPVLRLVSSPGGRILIADEVGLGKTIEAIYVWKELQARHGARRLLIVCPSMLKNKWQTELRDRFGIDGRIIESADELLSAVQKTRSDPTNHFVLIGSLEALRSRRPRNDEDEEPSNPRQRLAAFLARNEESNQSELFDLTIIDEAHYLRNPETATNYLGTLLANASSHLLLLSATPVQLGSENLFQLLRLLDADRYANMDVFRIIRDANRPIIEALNAVLRIPPDKEAFYEAIRQASQNQFFAQDQTLAELCKSKSLDDPAERVRIARLLESRSLLSDVLTRTRKRDVVENRVRRNARVIRIEFTPLERGLHDRVKAQLRARAYRSESAETLKMIGRLRQLASSIPAALASWREKDVLDEVLWEDLGIITQISDQDGSEVVDYQSLDIAPFEAADSKYEALRTLLLQRIRDNPAEKIVIFSFYRATLSYLERRLQRDGIATALIHGGIGNDRHSELARFESIHGPNVLLSSEVGSEGIDLQFARVLVNYDLPWNPMKVEQRIGRIDRLGQKAEQIHIINFVLRDTIEEIVLDRLFDRLAIFRSSIGDLEEVVGESVDELLVEYFRDGLSDEDLAARLEQNALAAETHRTTIKQLEEDAPELMGHANYILSSIRKSRESGHWITPADMLAFVNDFLTEFYPGSKIEHHPRRAGVYEISLSPDARAGLASFIQSNHPTRGTQLHVPGEKVAATFDIGAQAGLHPKPEFIDLTHPLALWLRAQIDIREVAFTPGVAIALDRSQTVNKPDIYIFATDLWRFEGLHKQVVLRHCALAVEQNCELEPDRAEQLINEAARNGVRIDMYPYQHLSSALADGFNHCERELIAQFSAEAHAFQLENEQRVRQAEIIAEERAAKRLKMLEERLASQRQSNDERRRRAIPMTEGQIRRLVADREQRLARIAAMKHADTVSRPVAGGIIVVR